MSLANTGDWKMSSEQTIEGKLVESIELTIQEIEEMKEEIEKTQNRIKAIDRVRSCFLRPYEDILIDYDWPNYDEHIIWVASAPFSEVLAWCETIRDEKYAEARLVEDHAREELANKEDDF